MSGGTRRSCDESAGGCGRSAEEGAVLRGRSALCESCKEAIGEAEADDAAKLEAAEALVEAERKLWCRLGHKHATAAEATDCSKVKNWKGEAKPPNVVAVQQLADAFHEVGKINHYMVGVTFAFSDEELDAAEQVLISKQNAGPQKGKAFAALERALDQIEAERVKRRQRAARGLRADVLALAKELVADFSEQRSTEEPMTPDQQAAVVARSIEAVIEARS